MENGKQMALPVVIFDVIQILRFEKASLNGAQYTPAVVAGYIREFICDSNVLEDEIRKIYFDYDFQEVIIYENQEEHWQDLELVENFSKIPSFIESPDSTTTKLENSITSTAITKSVIKTHE